MTFSLEAVEALIVSTLDDDKAEDIVSIDLAGKSSLADRMVVASGRSQRHVAALADRLARAIRESGGHVGGIEGLPHADWVVIDAHDVIIHLFRPEVRSFYNIERIWGVDAPRRAIEPQAPVDDASLDDDLTPDFDTDFDDE
jgi:ribosome-associated protein